MSYKDRRPHLGEVEEHGALAEGVALCHSSIAPRQPRACTPWNGIETEQAGAAWAVLQRERQQLCTKPQAPARSRLLAAVGAGVACLPAYSPAGQAGSGASPPSLRMTHRTTRMPCQQPGRGIQAAHRPPPTCQRQKRPNHAPDALEVLLQAVRLQGSGEFNAKPFRFHIKNQTK